MLMSLVAKVPWFNMGRQRLKCKFCSSVLLMVQIVCGPVQLFLSTSLIFVNQVPINCLKKTGKVQQ